MQRLANIAGEDKAEAYVEKLHHIEKRTDFKNLPGDSELRLIHASLPTLEINELKSRIGEHQDQDSILRLLLRKLMKII